MIERICSIFFVFPLLISCSQSIERLPAELELNDIRLTVEDLHTFGPAGINEAFYSYLMPEEVSKRIEKQGISFFDNLTTPSGDPEWMAFSDWKTPPMEKNEQWLQLSYRFERFQSFNSKSIKTMRHAQI